MRTIKTLERFERRKIVKKIQYDLFAGIEDTKYETNPNHSYLHVMYYSSECKRQKYYVKYCDTR